MDKNSTTNIKENVEFFSGKIDALYSKLNELD